MAKKKKKKRSPGSAPSTALNRSRPTAFHVMVQPRGAICNLDCDYCYFLSKEKLYPGSDFKMSRELLELYTRQYIDAQQVPEATFAWQGGEPTLMGLDFYKEAIRLQEKYCKPGMKIINSLQTNGTLLNDEWCAFFKEKGFLVGLSLDGPEHLHDRFRKDKNGGPSFQRVMTGLEYLKKHEVEVNILTTLNRVNADHPLEVYRFLRDQLETRFIQFIPIVERQNETGFQEGKRVTERSITADQLGGFLVEVFDEWVKRDVGRVFVQHFDMALAAWVGNEANLCIFAETCGFAMAMEHNGDLYSCDHYVEPRFKLGNIKETDLTTLAASARQRRFGKDKLTTLPQYCRDCKVRFICNGGCPKNRFIKTKSGEPGLNYLCEGYKAFFKHIDAPMRRMVELLRQRRPPADIMY